MSNFRDSMAYVAAEWQRLQEADDRTSPPEYPDMALISLPELAGVIARAQAAVVEWKPFAEAPRDGREIRVFDGKDSFSCWWAEGDWWFVGTVPGTWEACTCEEARLVWPPSLYHEMPPEPESLP